MGNVAALVAFGTSARLHFAELGGTAWGLPCIAPLLLLLRPEPSLCPWLLPHRRYLPPCAAITAGCALEALHAALLALGRPSSLADGRAPSAIFGSLLGPAALQLLALGATLPSQLSLLRTLWTGRTCPSARSAALGALCILPLIWAHGAAQAVGALAGIGYASAAMVLAHVREVEGLRKL